MSNLGLGGLVSGINTDDILYKLMQIENARIDLEKAQKTALAAKQDAWHKVKSSLETLRTKLDGVRMSGSFRTRQATLSDESVASVSVASGATLTTHSLSVTQLAQAHVVGGKLEASATAGLGYAGEFTINGKSIAVGTADTLYTLRDKINGTADVGVRAEVIKVTTANPDGTTTDQFRLTLTARNTGAVEISLADVTGTALNSLGIDTNADPAVQSINTLTAAQNAVFTLDNQAYETASNTISDAIPGLTITLKKAVAVTGAQTEITVGQNTGATAETVQSWVDALNESLDLMRSLTNYDSLSKEKGVLNGDSLARNIMSSLRSVLSTQVAGLPAGYGSLADIGITTGAWGTDNYGKVVLDKAKLTAKLTADEESVAKVFGALRVENNLALASAGGTLSASSTDPASDINAANDGIIDDRAWQSLNTPTVSAPETLTLTLPAAQSIDQIKLYTPDGAEVPTVGLKDFKLYYLNSSGAWTELQSVTNYAGTSRTISFDPVETTQVKLEISATYDSLPVKISEFQALETNRGVAMQMYRFVSGTLAFGSGPIDTRDSTYSDQIKALDDKISKMYLKMADQQARLKEQFDRMEQTLSKLNAQGAQLAAMMGTYTNQK